MPLLGSFRFYETANTALAKQTISITIIATPKLSEYSIHSFILLVKLVVFCSHKCEEPHLPRVVLVIQK